MKILLIHENTVTRKILMNYLVTELSGALVDRAASAPAGLDLLAKTAYDLVFCAREMADMDGFTLLAKMRKTAANKDSPFALMSASCDAEHLQDIHRRGVEHVLPLPCTPLDVKQLVFKAADPRRFRRYDRFSIPGATAVVAIAGVEIQLEVVNISNNGLLCRCTLPAAKIPVLCPGTLSVHFPEDYGNATIGGITASILRLTVETWLQNGNAASMQAVWRFSDVPAKSGRSLAMVLDRAKQDLLDTEKKHRQDANT